MPVRSVSGSTYSCAERNQVAGSGVPSQGTRHRSRWHELADGVVDGAPAITYQCAVVGAKGARGPERVEGDAVAWRAVVKTRNGRGKNTAVDTVIEHQRELGFAVPSLQIVKLHLDDRGAF
jgi:hypothetical protein